MAGMTSFRQILPLATTIVGTHVAFSLASIARAGIGGIDPSRPGKSEQAECFDAKHYDLVTDWVGRLYRGRGTEAASGGGVELAPTATFEDPAAVCVGAEEVGEAFRALGALNPVSVSPPRCIDVRPLGDSIELVLLLHQEYTLGGRSLRLPSRLHVTVQLRQMTRLGLPESEFLVTEMKELWHGNPLLWPYVLFYGPRRLNGILSYHATSRFLSRVP